MEFMNNFEAVVLLSPEITSNAKSSCLENLEKIINDKSGKIISSEDWGLRDISYKIGNFSKAFYSFYQIELDGDKIEGIKKILNQNENFIRHLFIRVEKHQELPTKLNNEKK
jgi:small subunit ribosomal protein S6